MPDLPDFDKLWDYNKPAETEARFRAILPEAESAAEATGDISYYLQLLTQIGRTLGLQRKFDQAHAILDEVETEMAGGDLVEVRYLLERGRAFNSSKQPETAVPLFKKAARLAQQLQADGYAVDALHMLGIAAPPEARLDWTRQAITYAETSTQEPARRWLGSLYNNMGWTLFDEKAYAEALDYFQRAQVFREAQGNEENIRIARWCVAKVLRVLGRLEESLAIQRDLENTGESVGFVQEEIGECLHAMGQVEAAKPYFKIAFEKLSQIDWVADDTARIERLRQLSE
jgi:tetratricopeptide (TPR) repeat protein